MNQHILHAYTRLSLIAYWIDQVLSCITFFIKRSFWIVIKVQIACSKNLSTNKTKISLPPALSWAASHIIAPSVKHTRHSTNRASLHFSFLNQVLYKIIILFTILFLGLLMTFMPFLWDLLTLYTVLGHTIWTICYF